MPGERLVVFHGDGEAVHGDDGVIIIPDKTWDSLHLVAKGRNQMELFHEGGELILGPFRQDIPDVLLINPEQLL